MEFTNGGYSQALNDYNCMLPVLKVEISTFCVQLLAIVRENEIGK